MKLLDRSLLSCGLLIPFWLALGVSLTAMAYPGYDHLQLAMSQLGAVGAPTHGLSPLVNNFPLALLFALFAWGIARRWRGSRLAMVSAVCCYCTPLAAWARVGSPATRAARLTSLPRRSSCTTCQGC